jgi:hypothetical protein
MIFFLVLLVLVYDLGVWYHLSKKYKIKFWHICKILKVYRIEYGF